MATLGRRRALGQHFLKDQRICELIADTAIEAAVKSGCKKLLEIGPGRGAITLPLISAAQGKLSEIILAERDLRLVDGYWKPELQNMELGELRVSIEEG